MYQCVLGGGREISVSQCDELLSRFWGAVSRQQGVEKRRFVEEPTVMGRLSISGARHREL